MGDKFDRNYGIGAIDVLGSVNVDLVSKVKALPKPGETVAGGELAALLGGKGANQAIAAARAGGRVAMHGVVGAQSFGLDPRREIAAAGVDVSGLAEIEGATGAALIAVDAHGENCITVSPGANGRAAETIKVGALSGAYLLAQLELAPTLVAAAFDAAKARGGTTILNAAPAIDVPATLLGAADILIVNETELATYAAGNGDIWADIPGAARRLISRDDQIVVVTLGVKGAMSVASDEVRQNPAAPAKPVDTTGAGDCFCGALTARLAEGASLAAALPFAAAAAAISVERPGAAPSMPSRMAIDARADA